MIYLNVSRTDSRLQVEIDETTRVAADSLQEVVYAVQEYMLIGVLESDVILRLPNGLALQVDFQDAVQIQGATWVKVGS